MKDSRESINPNLTGFRESILISNPHLPRDLVNDGADKTCQVFMSERESMSPLLERLLPKTDSRADRARAALVLTTCGAVILASLAMLLFWVFTSSLEEVSTAVEDAVLILILLGIVALNRRGTTRLVL